VAKRVEKRNQKDIVVSIKSLISTLEQLSKSLLHNATIKPSRESKNTMAGRAGRALDLFIPLNMAILNSKYSFYIDCPWLFFISFHVESIAVANNWKSSCSTEVLFNRKVSL